MLREAVVTREEDEKITLGVANAFQAKQLCNATIRPVIENAIFEVVGRNFRIECVVDTDMKQEKPAEPEETLLNDVKDIFEI
jgi:chromosomal replication initiation ATPase DnaA